MTLKFFEIGIDESKLSSKMKKDKRYSLKRMINTEIESFFESNTNLVLNSEVSIDYIREYLNYLKDDGFISTFLIKTELEVDSVDPNEVILMVKLHPEDEEFTEIVVRKE